jgi:hypothetical protein
MTGHLRSKASLTPQRLEIDMRRQGADQKVQTTTGRNTSSVRPEIPYLLCQ